MPPGAYEKSDVAPASDWVEAQCAQFDRVLEAFTAEMRAEFRRKALEGRARWDQPEHAPALYTSCLAHVAAAPLAAGAEAHGANFLAFLWHQRMARAVKP